jgi:hypothetical protein
MKTKLPFFKAAGIALLLSSQVSLSQTGGSFLTTTPSIGNGTTIEFENFDLGANADATVNAGGYGPFGYSDKSAGNSIVASGTVAVSSLRSTTDVDVAELVADPSFKYVSGIQGGEYLYFSVTVGTTGKYHIDINYAHGSTTNKRYKIERLNTDLTGSVVLVDGTADLANALPKTASSSIFGTNSAGPVGSPSQFDLEAGKSYVIKFTFNDAGPSFNYFQFIRDGNATTLGVNSFKESDTTLGVYPNPSNNGLFNLNIDSKWEVYSSLGAKILEGEGNKVDLTNFAKGTYILKTANSSKKLISK